LEEFSTLHKDLHQATFGDELRYSSRLLDLLPRGTVVYGAIPNVSGQLRDVYQLFLERLDESGALREWYQERFPADEGVVLGNIVEKLAGFGDDLGEEVVFAVVQLPEGSFAPVTLAEVTDESHLWAMANEEADRINDLAEKGPVVFVIEDPDAGGSSKGLFVLIEAGLVVVSPSLQVLELVGGDSLNEFSESRFYQSILASYSEGVDWLLSVDLQGLRGDSTPEELEKLGLSQLYDLVVQRKLGQEGIAENQAVLTYEGGEEGGIISWIADPGPIGGMEYVSPEAYVAAAFVVNDPAEMMESLMVYLEQYDTSAFSALEQFEAEHNISFLDDIAAPLGGEIVFCIDGPILPEPSWKVIVEVYDPQTLQGTIEYVVEEINRLVTHDGGSGIELLADGSGEMTVYSVRKMDSHSSFDYAFTNGYMIIATDRSLIYSARQFQDARYTLVDSPDFVRSLPRNGSVNLSAVFYQNLAPMVSAILSSPIGESVGGLSPEVRVSLEDLLGDAAPLLVTLNAEPGQLTLASGGDLESFWMNLGALASVGGPEGITDLLWGGVQGQ
jgi:hypothetical protein